MNWNNVLKVGGIWLGCFVAGLGLGNLFAPSWRDVSDVKSRVRHDVQVIEVENPASYIPVSIGGHARKLYVQDVPRTIAVARFNAGDVTYVYREDSNAVGTISTPVSELKDHHKMWSSEKLNAVLGVFGFATGQYGLKDVGTIMKSDGALAKAAVFGGCLVGIGFGFYCGYSADFNRDTDAAQRVLNDVPFWQDMIREYKASRARAVVVGRQQ